MNSLSSTTTTPLSTHAQSEPVLIYRRAFAVPVDNLTFVLIALTADKSIACTFANSKPGAFVKSNVDVNDFVPCEAASSVTAAFVAFASFDSMTQPSVPSSKSYNKPGCSGILPGPSPPFGTPPVPSLTTLISSK